MEHCYCYFGRGLTKVSCSIEETDPLPPPHTHIQVTGFSPPKPCVSFAHFGFEEELLTLIRKSEFSQPTPIQSQVGLLPFLPLSPSSLHSPSPPFLLLVASPLSFPFSLFLLLPSQTFLSLPPFPFPFLPLPPLPSIFLGWNL